MAYKHGVYVQEQATSLVTPIVGTAGLQVIFGTAPINLATDPYKAANTPILAYSFAEAVENVGYSDDFANYTLCQSIDACFRVFNVAPIILVNVLDPTNANHVTAVAAANKTITDAQIKLTDAGILLDTLVVKSDDGNTTYVLDRDYTSTFDDDGKVIISVLDSSVSGSTATIPTAATALKVSYTKLNPAGVTASDLIGGVTSAGVDKGLEVLRQIYPKFGMTPGLILAPGWSHDANVVAALEAKCEGINGVFRCECICDIGTDATGAAAATPTAARKYTDVKTAKENLGIDSAHAIACWPMVAVGSRKYYMSAMLGALIAYTDANNDDIPNLYPSNKSFGITGTVLEDGTEVVLDQEQANTVNSYGVHTALNMNGFKSWGNNMAIYPSSTDPKDRWIGVRRFFSWWANALILTYFQKVDDPANYRLIESIIDSENIRGNSYVARGYCAEARCVFLEDENPITDILNGQIMFHMYLAPYTPAQEIEFMLEFDPTAIQTALTGGAE